MAILNKIESIRENIVSPQLKKIQLAIIEFHMLGLAHIDGIPSEIIEKMTSLAEDINNYLGDE